MVAGWVGGDKRGDAGVGVGSREGSRGRRVCHKKEVNKDREDIPYYEKGEP